MKKQSRKHFDKHQTKPTTREAAKESNPHHGSSFDSFLIEENLLKEVEANARQKLNANN